MSDGVAGLLGKHVLAAVVVRPAARLQADSSQDSHGASRRGPLEQDLASRHVLSQREARHVPRSDRQQPTDAAQHDRLRVVRHQVSNLMFALLTSTTARS